MNKCKDCKWWEQPPGWGVCEKITKGNNLTSSVRADQHNPGFMTEPDFGCVLWEEKDK